MNKYIEIKNAHIHNLKGIDVKIPRNKLTVITGVSGNVSFLLGIRFLDYIYISVKTKQITSHGIITTAST